MTIEEKKEKIKEYCGTIKDCGDCLLYKAYGNIYDCGTNMERSYAIIFGEEKAENEEPKAPVIKDSGERREFDTGAVRDITEGKGRCDLLPLDVVGIWMKDEVIKEIAAYVDNRDTWHLFNALSKFIDKRGWNLPDAVLEVAKHFEDGAKKYGEYNWQKGIPENSYIDSSVRHYLKWLRGDQDEPHDRAFVWNILCLLWTVKHMRKVNKDEKK